LLRHFVSSAEEADDVVAAIEGRVALHLPLVSAHLEKDVVMKFPASLPSARKSDQHGTPQGWERGSP
jgi:hypothetical protein